MFFKMRSAYFVAAISSVLTVAAVASAKYKPRTPKVFVHAKAPGMKIEGVSSNLVIDETDKTVTFKTFLNSINTGNSMRNTHMQERMDAKNHNDITLTVDKDKLDTKKGGTVQGILNFHGVKKTYPVNYTVNDKHVTGSFGFNVNGHGIGDDQLCAFHVCADSNVTIDVDFYLAD